MANLSSELYHSVVNNSCSELRRLIEHGANVNQFYDDLSHTNSKAILHFACGKGHTECVKILLESGASVNVKDKWRMTPIMYCISADNIEVAEMLILKDPTAVDSQDINGRSPLHCAVERGSEKATRLLLKGGCDVNIQNFNGFTPLLTLTSSKDIANYYTLMEMLISFGADVNIESFRDRRTALHLAVISKKVDATQILLKHNAKPNQTDTSERTPLTNLMSYNISPYRQTSDMDADVMKIAFLLTEAGTEMNMFLSENSNPLLVATSLKCHELVRLFLENGADVNVTDPLSKITPLLLGVKQRDINTVRVLLNWKCHLTIAGQCRLREEEFEFDPFELAIHEGLWDIVQLLVLHGYNVSKYAHLQDTDGENGLFNSLHKNTEMLHFLQNCATCPNSLIHLCILTIFTTIKSNICCNVDLLPLPVALKNYIRQTFFETSSAREM